MHISLHAFLAEWKSWIWSAAIVVAAIVVALVVRFIAFAIIARFTRHSPTLLKDSLILHSQRVSRWILPLLALTIALPAAPLPAMVKSAMQHITGVAFIASIAWLVLLFTDVAVDIFGSRYRLDVADNLLARKVQTQLRALRRVIAIAIIVVASALALMTFPSIHQIGTSLLASAGLAGLVVGMAMKPTISSLLAGIQVALTQPIRLDDVVVVQGEWGWIEEIETTYVVVRIWDLRRLILPLSYFIEQPFENWTRSSADLLAYVILWVDYTTPIEELRLELTRILKSTNYWKGQANVLQVTDANERAMQIRALMDASDSSVAWNLRCLVREKLIEFIQQRHPGSLPRLRGESSAPPHAVTGYIW
jgi:small-conductance mechanosensitive channel